MMEGPAELVVFPRTLIGREAELSAVAEALAAPAFGAEGFYFSGEGGIGKTYLLNEVQQRVLARREQGDDTLLETGIIDLYHVRYHQPVLIMDTIVRRLITSLQQVGREGDYFRAYKLALQRYFALAGVDEAGGEAKRSELRGQFLRDYQQLAQSHRVVLIIDTLEKLHPEIRGAERFNFLATGRLEHWLLELLSELPNSLVVLAGRPRPRQQEAVEHMFGSRLHAFTVREFTPDETRQYVEAADPDAASRNEAWYQTLHDASGGRPVVLAVALSCTRALQFELTALPPGFDERYPANREALSELFLKLILGDIHDRHPPFANLLTKAVFLRKGLDIELLRQIAHAEGDALSADELVDQVAAFRHLPFAKLTKHTLLLHDEIYELLFDKLNSNGAGTWYEAAARYLGERLARIDEQLRRSQPSPALIQERQTTQVEWLFYRMALQPLRGYQDYRELCDGAIQARDQDFDTQLQDELARFYDPETQWGRLYLRELARGGISQDRMAYDEGVRWVYRRIATQIHGEDRYEEASAIASAVRAAFPAVYRDDVLARCDLDVAELQAKILHRQHSLQREAITAAYTQAVEQLEGLIAEDVASGEPGDFQRINQQQARFVLVRAYHYWGYYERVQQRLQSAIDKYKRALRLYKLLGREVERRRILAINSLGFAFAQQGALERGLHFAQQALELAQAEGAPHLIATVMNTLGRIQLDLDDPHEALSSVRQARQILASLGSTRHLALCAYAEGETRRWLAMMYHDSPERRQQEYREAIGAYEEALRLFEREGEPTRRIEVRRGMGVAYAERSLAPSSDTSSDADGEQALHYLHEALDICAPVPSPMRATLQKDIAVFYVHRHRFDEALAWLLRARESIPVALYDIRQGEGLTNTPESREQQVYWLILGQVELQYAMCAFGQGSYREACVRLLRAFACAHAFSPSARQLKTFRRLGQRELSAIGEASILEAMRLETYWETQELRLERSAFAELEQLFDEAVEDLELL